MGEFLLSLRYDRPLRLPPYCLSLRTKAGDHLAPSARTRSRRFLSAAENRPTHGRCQGARPSGRAKD